jgi:hypothetical protein
VLLDAASGEAIALTRAAFYGLICRRVFKILKRQLEALERDSARRFEDRMVTHLRATFPSELERHDVREVQELVRRGVERAGSYGITLEYEVCLYLHLVVVRGEAFDLDPSRPWIRYMLGRPRRGRLSKIEEIYDSLMAHHRWEGLEGGARA